MTVRLQLGYRSVKSRERLLLTFERGPCFRYYKLIDNKKHDNKTASDIWHILDSMLVKEFLLKVAAPRLPLPLATALLPAWGKVKQLGMVLSLHCRLLAAMTALKGAAFK